MRIEINTGGAGSLSMLQYQLDMNQYIADADSMINSFKAVKKKVYDLHGGVGDLEEAVSHLDARIAQEEARKAEAMEVRDKAEDFLDLARQVDKQVSVLVERNKEEFYRDNPALRPVIETEKGFLGQAWDWLCGVGKAVADGAAAAWNWTTDALGKAWNWAVDFYTENKKIIDTVLIVVGAVAAIAAVVVTGGAALVPLLTALGCSAATAGTISAAVAVTAVASTIGSSVMNIVDTWCEVDHAVFNVVQNVLNITSTVSNLAYSIGTLYNTIKKIDPMDFVERSGSTGPITKTSQLTPEQADALRGYTGPDGYRNVNNSLRGLEPATPESTETIRQIRSVLDNSSLPDDMVLYRGTSTESLGALKNLPPEELVGNTFTEAGFMSTSTEFNVARYQFPGDMKITVYASKGSQALNISSLSELPHEGEYLFNAGTQMLITSAEKVDGILFVDVLVQ